MKITICGSQTFCEKVKETQKYLTEKGFQVFVPGLLITEEFFQQEHSREELLKMKPIWKVNNG